MTDRVRQVERLLAECTGAERRAVLHRLRQQLPLHRLETEWNVSAEVILEAIARATDITQRGVRGIIAEAVFETAVLPRLVEAGWHVEPIAGHQSYDFLLTRDGRRLNIQLKLQRRRHGVPMRYAAASRRRLPQCPEKDLFVVEVQKTRDGTAGDGTDTPPYRFGEFDPLAVCLHPSTGSWQDFLFTLGAWLLPRPMDPSLVEKMQPVPAGPDAYWTDDVLRAAAWRQESDPKTVYTR